MPQKIDALNKAIEEKDYKKLEAILVALKDIEKDLATTDLVPNYKTNLKKVSSTGENILVRAIRENDNRAVSLILQYNPEVAFAKQEVRIDNFIFELYPFDVAIYFGSIDIFKSLLKQTHIKIEGIDYTMGLNSWNKSTFYNSHPMGTKIFILKNIYSLNNFNNIIIESLKKQENFNKLQSIATAYKKIRQAISTDNHNDKLILFNEAIKVDLNFTLECLHDIITEIKLGNIKTNFLNKVKDEGTSKLLRTFLEVTGLFFDSYKRHMGNPHDQHAVFDDKVLQHLSILYAEDVQEVKRPFADSDECAKFIEKYASIKPDWTTASFLLTWEKSSTALLPQNASNFRELKQQSTQAVGTPTQANQQAETQNTEVFIFGKS